MKKCGCYISLGVIYIAYNLFHIQILNPVLKVCLKKATNLRKFHGVTVVYFCTKPSRSSSKSLTSRRHVTSSLATGAFPIATDHRDLCLEQLKTARTSDILHFKYLRGIYQLGSRNHNVTVMVRA